MENSTAYTYVHDVFYLWLKGLERRFKQYFCNITSFPENMISISVLIYTYTDA